MAYLALACGVLLERCTGITWLSASRRLGWVPLLLCDLPAYSCTHTFYTLLFLCCTPLLSVVYYSLHSSFHHLYGLFLWRCPLLLYTAPLCACLACRVADMET